VQEFDPIEAPPEYDRLEPKVWVLGGIMLALALVALVLMLQDFSTSSYLYLAFYAIPANSAISVFPHEPVVIWYGSQGSILWTAVAASVGTMIAGYLDHSVFVPVMNLKGLTGYKEKGWYQKAARLFMKYPFAVIVVTGFTPIPFFPFKFLSFSLHYPLWKYLTALLVGRFPRYLLLAWIGYVIHIPGWLLIAIFGGAILAYAIKAGPEILRYLKSSRRPRDGAEAE
jgi:membrane protein YqaA with SNARE-associated domain